jgi:hypothetical protein
MSEITYLHYSGSDAEILALIKQLLQPRGKNNTQLHEPATPKPESAAHDEQEPETFREIARRFCQLLDEAAARGSFGQKDAINFWLLKDGKVEASELYSAAGAKDGKGWVPFGNGLTRNLRKAIREAGGGPPLSNIGRCNGIPSYPFSWYGYKKDPADGHWDYLIEPTLLPYLKAAFQIADSEGQNEKGQTSE